MRRRFLPFLDSLLEGIDASAIDREARKVLRAVLVGQITLLWEDFIRPYPEVFSADPRSDDYNHDAIHQLYDQFYQTKCEHNSPEAHRIFVNHLLEAATTALQSLTRRAIRAQFGDKLTVQMRIPSWPIRVPLETVKVKVEDRRSSEDAHKHYGGYFRGDPLMDNLDVHVFVEGDSVFMTAMGLLQEIVFGEGEDADHLVNTIAPVFIHEYVHLEQFLRGGSKHGEKDLGIVTTGGGRRGGRRDPKGGAVAYMRYKSSMQEMESFAAEATSQIIAGFRSYSSNPNEDISNALSSIAMGYSTNHIIDQYHDISFGYWSQEAISMGVPAEELKATYKHFLKQVYQKLWAYREQKLGKSMTHQTSLLKQIPENWGEIAKKHPLARAAALIAYDVAFNFEDIDYGPGANMMTKAGSFLESYYFDEHYDFEKSMKIQRAVSAMIRAQHEKMKLRHAA